MFSLHVMCMLCIFLCIFRHVYWLNLHPDYLFLMYFVRCQMTVTITLLLVYGPKVSLKDKKIQIVKRRKNTLGTIKIGEGEKTKTTDAA